MPLNAEQMRQLREVREALENQEPPTDARDVIGLLNDDSLSQLAAIAQPEDWSGTSPWRHGEYRILYNYLRYLYERLFNERKVLMGESGSFAAFNTGLLTSDLSPVYCFLTRDENGDWQFGGYVDGSTMATSDSGKRLVKELGVRGTMPERAGFGDARNFIYHDGQHAPHLVFGHIVDERIYRFPTDYLCQVTGGGRNEILAFQKKAHKEYRHDDHRKWIEELPDFVEGVNVYRLKRLVREDVSKAVELARQVVASSYAMAVPTWYVRDATINIMLPLALGGNEINLALVTSRQGNNVTGKTVYDLDMARACARLVSIPQAEWARGGKAPVAAPDLDITPVADRTAWLMWSGNAVSLFDGATIGRASSNHQANIELSGAAYAYASRVHGRFGRSGDAWTFTSEGKNGSRVRRMGEWITLESGAPFELKDGDRIQMGEPAGWHDDDWRNLVLFSTVEPDLDVTPLAQ